MATEHTMHTDKTASTAEYYKLLIKHDCVLFTVAVASWRTWHSAIRSNYMAEFLEKFQLFAFAAFITRKKSARASPRLQHTHAHRRQMLSHLFRTTEFVSSSLRCRLRPKEVESNFAILPVFALWVAHIQRCIGNSCFDSRLTVKFVLFGWRIRVFCSICLLFACCVFGPEREAESFCCWLCFLCLNAFPAIESIEFLSFAYCF